MRLIDADALKKAIIKHLCVKSERYLLPTEKSIYNCIDKQPTIELLKEKKARVMTLDEVKTFDWDYCYLEEERLPGKEYRKIFGDYALTCITWPCIASMRIQHGDKNYGRKWRCWSAKPTEEQRKAEPWKDGEQE